MIDLFDLEEYACGKSGWPEFMKDENTEPLDKCRYAAVNAEVQLGSHHESVRVPSRDSEGKPRIWKYVHSTVLPDVERRIKRGLVEWPTCSLGGAIKIVWEEDMNAHVYLPIWFCTRCTR